MQNKFPAWLEIGALFLLLLNIPVIIMETFPALHGTLPLYEIEWGFTILFTIDYLLRITLAQSKRGYLFSREGIVDLVATIPQYIIVLFPGASGLYLLRFLRLFRLIARGWRGARITREVLQDMLDVKKHFAPNERVVLKTHMSRIHYFGTYVALITVMIASAAGALLIHGPERAGIPILPAVLYTVLVITGIILARKEIEVLTQRYAITTHRVLCSTKLLEEHVTSIAINHVTDITLRQNLIEKFLDVGTLDIRTTGEITSMHLVGVKRPLQIKQLLQHHLMHHSPRAPATLTQ